MEELQANSYRSLHLFVGAGGGILGDLLLGHRPICGIEINKWCRKVLRARQKEGILPWFPIWDDVKTFDGRPWKGKVDIVCGGFPCQPYSTAGKKKGANDSRNLWPDTIRIIREVESSIAFLENVPGLLCFDYFGQILGDLAEAGYDAEWEIISASSLGAPHVRKRLWILAWSPRRMGRLLDNYLARSDGKALANTECEYHRKRSHRLGKAKGEEKQRGDSSPIPPPDRGPIAADSESNDARQFKEQTQDQIWEDHEEKRSGFHNESPGRGWWSSEPGMGRMVDGMAHRMERLRALGNGQVPAVVAKAFLQLAERADLIYQTGGWGYEWIVPWTKS